MMDCEYQANSSETKAAEPTVTLQDQGRKRNTCRSVDRPHGNRSFFADRAPHPGPRHPVPLKMGPQMAFCRLFRCHNPPRHPRRHANDVRSFLPDNIKGLIKGPGAFVGQNLGKNGISHVGHTFIPSRRPYGQKAGLQKGIEKMELFRSLIFTGSPPCIPITHLIKATSSASFDIAKVANRYHPR